MTIKALIYGGHQIIGARPIGSTSYAGVGLQFKGSVIVGGQYKDAYVSIEMSPADAIDIAAMLVKHAEQHGHQTLGIVRAYRGRQAKSAERDKQRGGK